MTAAVAPAQAAAAPGRATFVPLAAREARRFARNPVFSALAAAALFSPLRARVQHAADRRFNRARYDTERTVTAFAARLQGETDIAVVRADLLATINQTLEPAQLTVWLNPGPENGGQQADPGRRL